MGDHLPWVAGSVQELLDGTSVRVPVRRSGSDSGAVLERLMVHNRRCFLKVVSPAHDWTVRLTGNDGWEFKAWQAGLYHQAPSSIEHTMIGMALEGRGRQQRLAMLMDDRTEDLVPAGSEPISLRRHASFLEHMAQMHATYDGFSDDIGLMPMETRLRFLSPEVIAAELEADEPPATVLDAHRGWELLAQREPRLYASARRIHADPAPLTAALAETPHTFSAGDWRLENLGTGPQGQTILLDWAHPGQAPYAWDLAWYIAVNRPRLPEPRESAILRYRAALEAAGIVTDPWWQAQLDLCLLALIAGLGWGAALREPSELGWWATVAERGAERLG